MGCNLPVGIDNVKQGENYGLEMKRLGKQRKAYNYLSCWAVGNGAGDTLSCR